MDFFAELEEILQRLVEAFRVDTSKLFEVTAKPRYTNCHSHFNYSYENIKFFRLKIPP